MHFNYYDTDIYRGEYFYKLTKIFSKYNIGEYKKNNEDIFELLMKYGNLDKAINNAKQLYEKHNGNPPSKMAPATRVYELVEELKPHIV